MHWVVRCADMQEITGQIRRAASTQVAPLLHHHTVCGGIPECPGWIERMVSDGWGVIWHG